MKSAVLLCILCTFMLLPAHARVPERSDYAELISRAEEAYNKKNYAEAAKEYSAAFAHIGGKGLAKDRYNAARAWSLSANPDSAFDCLQRIAEKTYFDDVDKIVKEEDFVSLHADARWKPLVETIADNRNNKLPGGWFRAGSKPAAYFMGMDKGAGKDKNDVITIRSKDKLISGFGTVMQSFLSEKYLGERVRMTGYIKTKDVDEWAGLWLRVDGKKRGSVLAFDNMKDGKADRSVKGTTDWTKYEIVLDISEKTRNISFGVLLSGTGQVWFDKIEFEVVNHKTETTGKYEKFREPQNLNMGK